MASAILIPADHTQPVRRVEVSEHAELVALVGGYLDSITIRASQPYVVLFNEDGKQLNLEVNVRATLFLASVLLGDFICGNCVIVGFDNDGDTRDAPAGLEERIPPSEAGRTGGGAPASDQVRVGETAPNASSQSEAPALELDSPLADPQVEMLVRRHMHMTAATHASSCTCIICAATSGGADAWRVIFTAFDEDERFRAQMKEAQAVGLL